jgi:hypothetical protein
MLASARAIAAGSFLRRSIMEGSADTNSAVAWPPHASKSIGASLGRTLGSAYWKIQSLVSMKWLSASLNILPSAYGICSYLLIHGWRDLKPRAPRTPSISLESAGLWQWGAPPQC